MDSDVIRLHSERVVVCGYCGEGPVLQDLHGELIGLLSRFRHEHDGTWQNIHETAARVEALVLGRLLDADVRSVSALEGTPDTDTPGPFPQCTVHPE
jgi:hypothetical protein